MVLGLIRAAHSSKKKFPICCSALQEASKFIYSVAGRERETALFLPYLYGSQASH
jgi:hypothetical protein